MSPAQLRRGAAAFTLALSVGVLSACGGSDEGGGDGGGSAASSSTTGEAGRTEPTQTEPTQTEPTQTSGAAPSGDSSAETQALAVTSVDFDFELASTDLQAGEYQVSLTNNGDATHDLIVEQDGNDIAGSDAIGPGESTTFSVTLEPGEYVFYCSVGNHRAMGMEIDVSVS